MAIIRWRDPAGLTPGWGFWPTAWDDEDFWPEEREGLTAYETDDAVVAQANVPGIPAEKVDVSFEDGVLTIKAEYVEEEEEKKKRKTTFRQARRARYYYTFSVPASIDSTKIDAVVKDGVVSVTMPKAEQAKPKKIRVRVEKK